LLGQFLVSTDRQSRWTVVMVAATLATIPLDLLLIPWCVARFGNGALGGALAFVVTEAGMTLAGIALLPHGALTRANAWRALRVLLAGLLMLAAAWPLRHAFVALPILAGAVVYPVALWLLRAVDPADARLLLDMAQTVLGRFRRRPAPRQV
ncbi:MAG: polysaccharide biosynthesis C-terminal domain-containing protein, partial [Anaerolineales bacterium]|nr:polysaccharide biosynthesis C-terminal domain-containing protein [Anaerolineales bacterium]